MHRQFLLLLNHFTTFTATCVPESFTTVQCMTGTRCMGWSCITAPSVMVGVLTSLKLANATAQGLIYCLADCLGLRKRLKKYS
jgi:hypothetical protein